MVRFAIWTSYLPEFQLWSWFDLRFVAALCLWVQFAKLVQFEVWTSSFHSTSLNQLFVHINSSCEAGSIRGLIQLFFFKFHFWSCFDSWFEPVLCLWIPVVKLVRMAVWTSSLSTVSTYEAGLVRFLLQFSLY